MKCSIEHITPAKAKKYLANSDNLRKPNRRKIALMVRDIKAGAWEDNGESVKFRKGDGAFIDGQNRLHAIVESGRALDLVCVRDCAGDLYVDMGEKRTLAQYLTHLGMSYPGAYAATVGNILTYEAIISGTGERSARNFTQYDRILHFDQYRKRMEKVVPAIFCTRKIKWRSSFAAVLTIGTCPKDFRSAKDLAIEKIETGEDLKSSDPLFKLREQMLTRRRGWLPQDYRLALIIKAWNAHRDGLKLQRLHHRFTGPTAEDFPRIK